MFTPKINKLMKEYDKVALSPTLFNIYLDEIITNGKNKT
jgi:hypothetical protein